MEENIKREIRSNAFGPFWFFLIVLCCGRGCGTVDISPESIKKLKTIKCTPSR